MGISRDSRHKKRVSGGRMPIHKKKRKFEMGRQASMTKIGTKKISVVRGRGGNLKYRAIKLDFGNFVWASEKVSFKCRIYDTVYNATSNEYTRTKTLVKNSIIQIDGTPFKNWYLQHYNIDLSGKGETMKKKLSTHLQVKMKHRQKDRTIDDNVAKQVAKGKILACISSRPGQSGRADGYILEGKELLFYLKQVEKKH